MIARTLAEHEWARLEETDHPSVLSFVDPKDMRVVVVEDEGKIRGSMAILRVTHLENVWVARDAGAGVKRLLIESALTAAREWSRDWAMASVGDDQVADLVTRIGGRKIPDLDTYMVSLEQ
jgi:hypothetical protein